MKKRSISNCRNASHAIYAYREYLSLHERYSFRVSFRLNGSLRHAQTLRFPDVSDAGHLLRVTNQKHCRKKAVFLICDPTGNRTLVLSVPSSGRVRPLAEEGYVLALSYKKPLLRFLSCEELLAFARTFFEEQT
jgi:hypothetical protein